MNRHLKSLAIGLGLMWCAKGAKADMVHWLLTEWGSVYRNFQKVEDKKYKEPEQIAGTADHYYVATRDGSIYRDGAKIEDQVYKNENIEDLDAWGDDYYLLVLQGRLYKNGKVLMPEGKITRPKAMVVIGADIWIIDDGGRLYKNGEQIGQYYLKGYYPDHFAVAGNDFWFSISAGTTGGHYIYKNKDEANSETWLVREFGAFGGDFYIFSGKSIFKNFERIARFEADRKTDTGRLDNIKDFHFVVPLKAP